MPRPSSLTDRRAIALALAALAPAGLDAQAREAPSRDAPRAPAARAAARAAAPDSAARPDLLGRLRWRSIGPANQAGRVSVVTGVPGDPNTWYVGAAAGGIFKTTNGGTTFEAIFDDQPVASIGAIAVAPSDRNVVWVGTGEGNPRNSASIGNGVYRSLDAGRTWQYLGLPRSDKIARIVVDPRNADAAYVCVLGREWGEHAERGLYRTTDGGKSWALVLHRGPRTGCSDVDIDPTNFHVVYAGMHTHLRRAYYFTSGGGETALYRSRDGGATWERLSGPGNGRGLPNGDMDRIGVAVARSEPDVVYAVSETKAEGVLWRSDDGGDTWRTVNRDPNINFRPFYYSDIRVDPQDPNRVYSLSGALYLSEDGGRSFRRIAQDVHGDHQAMWIDPTDARRVLSGSDGGYQLSNDRARTWEIVNNVAMTQFYHVNYDMRQPYTICGGLQDNGHWCGPVRTALEQGIRKRDWVTVSGGDGFFAVPDLARPWLVYTASQGGNITVTDTRSGATRSIHPYPYRVGSAGDSLAHHRYRFNWNAPIVLAPDDPQTVYFGGNVLFRSRDVGQSWQPISPDLSTNDKSKQRNSGGPIVRDNTAAEFHSTILTIAPSPKDPKTIWVGTDDGNVQLTRDGGATWTNVVKNIAGLAPNAWIPTIDASPHDACTAWVAADRHQDDDYRPYAFVTRDCGRTFIAIGGGLPPNGWVHVVREDPRVPNLLYAGTELGIHASWDGGRTWQDLRGDMAAAPVRDLFVHPRDNDLVIGTHGRGIYVLDDIAPLQQRARALAAAGPTLFAPRPAIRWEMWQNDANLAQKEYVARNPAYGVLVSYHLPKRAVGEVTLAVRDAGGTTIRTLRQLPRAAGINRVNWDLRYEGAWTPPDTAALRRAARAAEEEGTTRRRRGAGEAEDEFARFSAPRAPVALPGTYTLALTVDGTTLTESVRIDPDPRVDVPAAALQAQLAAGLEARELLSKLNRGIDRLDETVRQLQPVQSMIARRAARDTAGMPLDSAIAIQVANRDPAYQAASTALARLRKLRDEELVRPVPGLGYRQYPRVREEVQTLLNMIVGAPGRPTEGQRVRLRELQEEVERLLREIDAVTRQQIAEVERRIGRPLAEAAALGWGG